MAKCPICKSDAQEIEPGFFDGKTFRCPTHHEFEVADTVLKIPVLMDADSSQWEGALKKATNRSAPGRRPRIFSTDFGTPRFR